VTWALKGEVANVPGVGTVLAQDPILRWRWLEPVSGHKSNVLSTTDILEGSEAAFIPGLMAGVSALRN
jgi:hypothetical protein